MRARPNTRNVLSLALAATFLAAQLLSFSHLLLVKHVTCPEHGELIHVAESSADAAAPIAEASALEYRAAPRFAATHDHDHCLASTARRERMTIDPPAGGLHAPVALAVKVGAARGPDAPAPVALLRLAPKSSPPA